MGLTSQNQRVSVIGGGDGLSDGEGVVATFFLIRYQSVVASRREINFARQFSSVSLVHRMETNIERQFFEVCPSIFVVPCRPKSRLNRLNQSLCCFR